MNPKGQPLILIGLLKAERSFYLSEYAPHGFATQDAGRRTTNVRRLPLGRQPTYATNPGL